MKACIKKFYSIGLPEVTHYEYLRRTGLVYSYIESTRSGIVFNESRNVVDLDYGVLDEVMEGLYEYNNM